MKHQAVRNKNRGKDFERECVEAAIALGIQARRAWGSDGRSLGLTEDVDITLDAPLIRAVQCKLRKRINTALKPSENVNAVFIKQPREEVLAIIRLKDLFELLKKARDNGTSQAAV